MKHFIDKLGWPLEMIKGHPIRNFFRIIIHARGYREWQSVGRTDMQITLRDLTIPQAAAMRAMFERMRQLGGMGASRFVEFYADGDGNFRPRPEYKFTNRADDVEKWSEGECAWSDDRDAFSVDFDTIAWKRELGDNCVGKQTENSYKIKLYSDLLRKEKKASVGSDNDGHGMSEPTKEPAHD